MESRRSSSSLDDALELERVAVGPYCIFDDFKPPSWSPQTNLPATGEPSATKVKMEDPMMSSEYPFETGMQAPWLPSSAEDFALVTQPSESLSQGNWEEWMRWDATSQAQSSKSLNTQGPVCYIRSNQQKAPLLARRQNSQLRNNSQTLQSGSGPGPIQTPTNNITFTFGENAINTPAFHFNNGPISSPAITEGAQSDAFFAKPAWDQPPQHLDQNDNVLFSPLSFSQKQTSNIALPPQSTPSLQHSPSSANVRTSSSSSQSSPEPGPTSNSKKRRKPSADEEMTETKPAKQPPVKKTAHNMIEKRYRTNLNDKIAALRDSVPSLRVMSRSAGDAHKDDDAEDLEGLTPAHKLNKATVLSKATEYIRHLEKRNKRLTEEVATLKARLDSYDKLAMTVPMAGIANSVTTPDGLRYQEDPFAAAAAQGPRVTQGQAQGMIPVPESMANLHRMPNPQHYTPQQQGYPAYSAAPSVPAQQQPVINGRRSNGMMSKLMVGSLAGLMVLGGLSERERSGEEPNDRGLLAFPLQLINSLALRVSVQGTTMQLSLLPVFKLFIVFGVFFYIIAPLLQFKPRPKKKRATTVKLAPAPSLASPVEVRRKAWLTAIQTVWVPRHSFYLEVAALGLKMLKLSTRKLIGWPGYAFLTGTTKEQEAARVKAWEIALDAQLTGGDAEISMSRLILTLMASGTLPDSPARLMLKALHIRVLLWEVAKAGYGTWYMFDELSAKLARVYWNSARSEHRVQCHNPSKDGVVKEDALPKHLAALLELECDDVLVPNIIQRAYNLAWNRPSAENTETDAAMDCVVEDFAIASPLDALAAWWSSHVLSRSLVSCLASETGSLKEEGNSDLELAISTSPPASVAQLRALVAKAVLVRKDRDANIMTAFKALPSEQDIRPRTERLHSSPRQTILMNIVGNAPAAADVRTSLTLAKCLSLVEQSRSVTTNTMMAREALLRATHVVNNMAIPEASLTLMSFVAAYTLVNTVLEDEELLAEAKRGLERIVSSLRVWTGRAASRRCGLSSKTREKVVERCLGISKMLVGMNDATLSEDVDGREECDDAGYVSQSEGEVEGVKTMGSYSPV